jgi:hypothetical protein
LYPEDEDRDGLRNVGLLTAQPFDPADSPRELPYSKSSVLNGLKASRQVPPPSLGLFRPQSIQTFSGTLTGDFVPRFRPSKPFNNYPNIEDEKL